MQALLRTAFALAAFMLLTNAAMAADAGSDAASESKAIQGDEGKMSPPASGGGASDASSASGEAQAVQGDEGKMSPPASGGGSSDATDPAGEAGAIKGDEGK